MASEEWMTVKELAALCHAPRRTILYHIQLGALQARRHGLQRFVVDRVEAEKYAAQVWGTVISTDEAAAPS